MKKFLPFLVFISLFFCACTTGLGEEIDLEAPELTILTPTKLTYQQLEFDMAGTCTDNKGITDVTITNKETGKIYGYADIDYESNTWSFKVSLSKEEEGEITFLVTANDAFKNSSTKSARTITLLVDEHAPEGSAWYVDRGNSIQTPLKDITFLENLDLDLAVNKDYPQNEKFTVYGNFYDAMSISTITLKLYEVSDHDSFNIDNAIPIIEKTVTAADGVNYIGDGKSIYSPSFEFTHAELAEKGLGSGKHYLRVGYYAKDNDDHPNEIINDTELYIFWYPESDKPGVQHSKLENEKLSASVGSSIPLDFFDDDGLKNIKYSLRSGSSVTESYVKNNLSTVFTEIKDSKGNVIEPAATATFTNDTTRDVPVQIKAPEIPGQMQLIAYAQDINGNISIKIVEAEITDSQKPLLFIESPSENTIPAMKSGSTDVFQIKGYSLDTKGSQYVAIIYNPEGTGTQETAQKFFEDNSTAIIAASAQNKPYIETATGKAAWYHKFTTNNFENSWNKQLFEIDMNLMQHFKDASGKSAAAERKYFEILLLDNDNNVVYKPFILNGDSTLPSIDIVTPSKELDVHDFTQNDLVIKFKGIKDTGLGMNESMYKVTTVIGENTYTYNSSSNPRLNVIDGYATVTIPKATLSTWANTEAQPTFKFYATDVLGNGGKGEGQRSIILSPRPVIESITVDKNSGTYKAGDVLKFKVTFSKQVKVTGIPQLKIKYSNSSDPILVDYTEGSGSNSLLFNFTVPVGAKSDGIICEGFNVSSENVFPAGIIVQATELGEGNVYTELPADVITGKTIKLDGVAPNVTNVAVMDPDSTGAYTKDKELTAIVTMSEPVLVSGSPILMMKIGTTNVNFSFQKMNGNDITFVHKVTTSDPQGLLKYNKKTIFSTTHAGYITDKVGNKFSLSTTGNDTDTAVSIDYTAPTTQPTTNITEAVYNTAQTITLSNIETGATAYYSINGGVSWKKYDETNKETIGNGIYKIITRQMDRAGNMSSNSAVKTVEINNIFAPITGFSIDLADGNYKANTKISFTLDFDQAVVVKNATDIRLTFASKENPSVTKVINTKTISNETTSVKFEYTTGSNDFFDGVMVTKIEFVNGFKDVYGNTPAFASTPSILTPTNCNFLAADDGGNREGIVLDSILPVISTMIPAMSGTNSGISTITDNSLFKVTLNFAEKVYVEEGEIILQRKGNWAVPAVFNKTEFMSLYNKMNATNREYMMETITKNGLGNEATNAKTGIPVGPYQKITHGLKIAGTNVVPDTDTKFVLAFDYGLMDDNDVINNIRNALKSVDYDRHTIDVTSKSVVLTYNADGTTKVEITFANVEDGREWDLIIPPKAFRDNTENFYRGMNLDKLREAEKTAQGISDAQQTASEKYSLWSNNVAIPVVRVDRYSHGWGAKEPYYDNETKTWKLKELTTGDRKFTTDLSDTSGRKIAPTGYVRVRIDCETPGASINYKNFNQTEQTVSNSLTTNAKFSANSTSTTNKGKITNIADIAIANLRYTPTDGETYSGFLYIGDGKYTTARKDYVSSYATKTGFINSGYGYEGVFKTVIYTTLGADNKNYINIEGGTAPGGEPSVSGFPLRDGTSSDETNPYSKNAYKDGNSYYWVSYEIVSTDFAILLCRNNHSSSYPLCSYGQGIYIEGITWESNG